MRSPNSLARRRCALILGAACALTVSLAGWSSPSGAQSGGDPPSVGLGSKADRAKTLALYRKCGSPDPEPLSVNLGIKNTDRGSGIVLRVRVVNSGNRQKFSWQNPSKYRFCAIRTIGNSTDGRRAFFPKPTRVSAREGYYLDPYSLASDLDVEQFVVFLKKR